MNCKDVCDKYPNCLKYKLVKNQKNFIGEVEVCKEFIKANSTSNNVLDLRPDMEGIEEEFRIFQRPSADSSRAMADYIYIIENKLKEI